jgi:hypothetical protein
MRSPLSASALRARGGWPWPWQRFLHFCRNLLAGKLFLFFLLESYKGTGTIEPGLRCAGAGNSHDLWVALMNRGGLSSHAHTKLRRFTLFDTSVLGQVP